MKTTNRPSLPPSRAFTLIELLVALVISFIVAATGFSVAGAAKRRAMMAKEMSAAHNLMTAFHLYSADNGGEILPGYRSDPEMTNDEGETLYAPANARYPWRIWPYLEDVKGSLVFNGNEAVLEEGPSRDYMVSVSPNLGMNATFVGGHYGSGSLLRPSPRIEEKIGRFCVRNTSDLGDSNNLIVFASARSNPDEAYKGRGYFEVQPPNCMGEVWKDDEWDVHGAPSDHGFVDFRWSRKAVVALVNGSVTTMDESEMRDMRNWSRGAAKADNADYFISRPSR